MTYATKLSDNVIGGWEREKEQWWNEYARQMNDFARKEYSLGMVQNMINSFERESKRARKEWGSVWEISDVKVMNEQQNEYW